MKEMLVDAICGAGVPREMTRGEHADFTTTAWGTHRAWKRPALQALTEEELRALYTKIKDSYASK